MQQNNMELGNFVTELIDLKEGVIMTTKSIRILFKRAGSILRSELQEYFKSVLGTERTIIDYDEKLGIVPLEIIHKTEPPGSILTRIIL